MDRRSAVMLALLAAVGATALGELAPGAGGQRAFAASCSRGALASIDRIALVARRRYHHEAAGRAAHVAAARVARDRVLLHDLGAGNLGAALAQARRELAQHVVRIRITRSARGLIDTDRSFAVAGTVRRLPGGLGRLELSIQDIHGFIRLVHKYTGAALLVRGAGGELETSLLSADRAMLPASGCVALAGRGYAVREFAKRGFAGERLTVWVLHP